MKEELENKLFEDFPDLFPHGRNVDPRKNLMAFGIMCDDGWYDLIYQLCEDIQEELDKDEELKEAFQVMEVKEKFAGLRFYVSCASDKIFDMIQKAENKSYRICEVCGDKGMIMRKGGWYKTMCRECADKEKGDWVEVKNFHTEGYVK